MSDWRHFSTSHCLANMEKEILSCSQDCICHNLFPEPEKVLGLPCDCPEPEPEYVVPETSLDAAEASDTGPDTITIIPDMQDYFFVPATQVNHDCDTGYVGHWVEDECVLVIPESPAESPYSSSDDFNPFSDEPDNVVDGVMQVKLPCSPYGHIRVITEDGVGLPHGCYEDSDSSLSDSDDSNGDSV